ncbi:ets DNA-binding protein pokkuri isoform X2 [Bradysia coprophila]|nr:ets DNA-binding protein pokkuri isoform X2 [Bradysia coprophila]
MKLLPIPLPPIGAPPPMGIWGSDFMWRYSAPHSPLAEMKTQLPPQLSPDPRIWGREDVAIFLQFCEREFDLPKFDLELFQMNGKALCLLTKNDLAERIPGAGDILYNVLQMLIRESQMLHKHLPSSPVTPTSRYPFSPHSQPPTPNWSSLAPPDSPFHAAHIQHLMQSNSVTLSPAPSIDSQGRSPPQHQDQQQVQFVVTSLGSQSNQSDSDEDSYSEKQGSSEQASPPLTPLNKEAPLSLSQQISNVVNSWSVKNENGAWSAKNENGGSNSAPSTPGAFAPVKREFFPDTPEPNTNGRLLWDFLQQLLNDPAQRYSNFIAWKCRDTGVFKIVDPAGLAKLWGIQKNHLSMNYDKMSRALRYYYRVNILRKVQGERHCYQFLRNPTELKSIKNISLLRQQTQQSPQNGTGNQNTLKQEQQGDNYHRNASDVKSMKGMQFLRQPTQQLSQNGASNQSNLKQEQQVENQHHQQQHMLNPLSLSNGSLQLQQSRNTQNQLHLHQLSPLSLHQQQQQQMLHQNPPPSPRVLALNGAFHQLTTSSSPTLIPHHQNGQPVTHFKMEPNMDVEDLPTDLSTTSGNSERNKFNGNSECFP